jgi:outer membrane lipoprotein-sorting protein
MNDKQNLSRNLHDLSQIVPDAEITNRAIQRAQSALDHQPIASISHQRAKLVRLRNIASLAAAAVVLFLLTAWLSSVGSNGSIAFAQVQAQVEKTKSVQYVQTRRDVTKQNQKAPVTEERVMVLGNLQRKEFQVIEPGDDLPDGASWATATEKIVTIYDPEKGKMLNLLPERKGYSYVKGFLSINPDDGKVETEELKPSKADFYKQIRDVPRDKAKQLPAKTVDGKSAVGFFVEEKIERKTGIDTWKRTYWVDEKTKLPIRIEVSMTSTVPMHGNSNWVINDIVFDAPLDAKLFSLEPPEGYKDLAKLEEESPKQQLNAGGLVKALVFAEVVAALQAEVEKAKTVVYVESKKVEKDNKVVQDTVRHVKILGSHLKREEVNLVSEANPDDQPNWVNITNLEKKKEIKLFPPAKTYREKTLKFVRKRSEREDFQWVPDGKPNPKPQFDLYELMREVPAQNAKGLPGKIIDGKTVACFSLEEKEEHKARTRVWKHVYWVDPKTKLPVRIEASCRTEVAPPHVSTGNIEVVISDLAFDVPLDPALFSTEPPEGYRDLASSKKNRPSSN